MTGVLSGFTVIIAVVALGWVLARRDTLGANGAMTLNKLVFFVATPALLIDSLSRTTLGHVFGPVFAVSALSAIAVSALYLIIAHWWLRPAAPDLVIGALSSGYVNSANLGIPIALYVLGDLGFVTPLLLFQVALVQPAAIAALEQIFARQTVSHEHRSTMTAIGSALSHTVRTPLVLAALGGVVIAAVPWQPPDIVLEPVHLVGQTAVPGALLVFGMSLYGVRVLDRQQSPRREIFMATVLKIVVHPLIAWCLGTAIFGMRDHQLLTVVVAATLPTAQNVLVLATRYNTGRFIARDTAVLSTFGAFPVMVVVTRILHG